MEDILSYLLYCSIIIPLIPLCFYPVQGYIKSRMPVLIVKIILALSAAAVLLALIGSFIIPLPSQTDYVLVPVGIYCFYLYNREVKILFTKKLFVFLTACVVGGYSFLFATVADYTIHPTSNYLNFSTEALTVQILILAAADVVLCWPLSKYLGWVISNLHEEAIWKRVWIFPALFFAATFCMFPREYSTMYVWKVRELYPVALCLFVFLGILVYFLFYVVAYTYVEKQRTEIANRMLAMQGTQYQQLLRTVEENSRIRHDFRHQLIVIAELVGQKEYEKLEEYVRKYIDDGQAEVKLYSYSAAVNALISYYESVCMRRGIRTEFAVSLPNRLPVSDQDFCVMLGNLLENAIDGSGELEDPYICLKIGQTSSNMLAVKVMNPCQGELVRENGHYRSTKRDGYGQGLESVNLIAEKYQGVMEILADGKLFTVKVLLQIPGRSAGSS